MALTCDNCGSIIGEAEYITVPFDLTEDKVGAHTADDWFYYCEDGCAKAVRGLLENLRQAGHENGEGELRWVLAEPEATVESSPDEAPKKAPASDDWDERWGDLCWKVPGYNRPVGPEYQKRIEAGLPLSKCVHHKASLGRLRDGDLLVLEDVARLTQAELEGVPGVGPTVVGQIMEALDEEGLTFVDGPSKHEIGRRLREHREGRGGDKPERFARGLAEKLGIPPTVHADNEKRDVETRAYRDLLTHLRDAEAGRKPLPPWLLPVVAEGLGLTRDQLLTVEEEVA